MKNDEWFRTRAKELYHEDGEIEVDSDACVSIGDDDGAYVAAWVWVPLGEERSKSQVRGRLPMTRSIRRRRSRERTSSTS